MRDDETEIKGNFATVIVRNDHGPNPECNRGQLYLELEGGKFTGLDADELREAIDSAVGPREADMLFRDQASIYCEVAVHPVFDECWTFDNPSAEAMIEKLDELSGSDSAPAKPYRPADRDRLLRHIEDIEATLTRRNERHEEDQERIRELRARVEELESPESLTVDEHIEAAWDAAHVPADGKIHPGERYIFRFENGNVSRNVAHTPLAAGHKYRLIDPRTEPTPDERYKGLEEWEIELLLSHNRS